MKNLAFFALLFLSFGSLAIAAGTAPSKAKPLPVLDIVQTVVKSPLARGVSMNDAVEAMKIRANALNIKLVAEMPLSRQIEAMGEKSRRIDIYQFCDPLTAKKMVEYDIHFAAYLPCRIALVEDAKGQGWLAGDDEPRPVYPGPETRCRPQGRRHQGARHPERDHAGRRAGCVVIAARASVPGSGAEMPAVLNAALIAT